MNFSTAASQAATNEVLVAIRGHLARQKKVVWFVSGGSCIIPEIEIVRQLPNSSLTSLKVMLVDERFGPSGHASSNYLQLTAKGFARDRLQFDNLLACAESLGELEVVYSDMIHVALQDADVVIATLGIGQDGHIAGILPSSPVAADSSAVTKAYHGTDFTRLTCGFATLRRVDEAYVFAYGPMKQKILAELRRGRQSLNKMPASILYDIPVTKIYNDTIGSEG